MHGTSLVDVNIDTGPRDKRAVSAAGWQWQLREADERLILSICQHHTLPEALARILAIRGVGVDDVDAFLNPSLKTALPDPAHLLDMEKAASRIATAVTNNEKIAIWGDYDVDGATSSALLMRYLRALGAKPIAYIPDRMKEGYGPNAPALLKLKEEGATLAITVDCGTLAFEPLEAAANVGLDIIVIDHHQGEVRLPKAVAVVNPNRFDESSPHKHMAAVGVAFLLCVAVNRKLREQNYFASRDEPDLRQWLDIVALGTVCDVVSLTGVNRAFVAQGLKVMAGRENVGLRTVLDLAAVDSKPTAYHAGFVIGPRINAGGRVGKSDLGVRLLITDDAAEALALAKELEIHNAERKTIESMIIEQAMEQAARADKNLPMLVLSAGGWHPGVIGIVAGRVKERFHKPVAIIGVENGIGKASARSVDGFDIGAAVIAARDAGLLLAGGGHAMAAGFTVEENKIPALVEFLGKRAGTRNISSQKTLHIDAALSIGGATLEFTETLERLGPFGQGNPSVRLALHNVINLKPEWTKGEQHARTLLICPLSNARLLAVAFRVGGTMLGDAIFNSRGRKISVAGQLKLNEWMGKRSVNFHIEDIAGA
jgi:single-stranded-DNA-specific exonuclease